MPESNYGKVYHTADGKTVFVDPKTNKASIFDGILTVEKIVEPANGAGLIGNKDFFPALLDLFILSGQLAAEDEILDTPDILGPKDYFILAPDKAIPLSVGASPVRAWVSEYKNGHKPDYKGFHKHKILPEQWDWLNTHKTCSIVAWYDQECPAFIALACQDHAKIIKPVPVQDGVKVSPIDPTAVVSLETSTVQTGTETVLTEERDV